MPSNIESVLAAIRNLAGELGEVKGEFKGLKEYIETQTAECRSNYKDLNKGFNKVRGRLNGITIEDEVTDKIQRRLIGRRKFVYNTVTLLCVIAMTLGTVFGVDRWRSAQKSPDTVYTQADARKDQALILSQIRELTEKIGK